MRSMIRFEPVRECVGMQDMVDRLLDEGFPRPILPALWDTASIPTMDLYQTEDCITVKMGLPGVQPEDIQISVTNGVLSIRGEVKEEKEDKEKTYHLRERRYGSFSRSVTLPNNVSVDKSDAVFENGVLTLTLPKAEEAKAKTINIKPRK
jgi:HSP20 family protein